MRRRAQLVFISDMLKVRTAVAVMAASMAVFAAILVILPSRSFAATKSSLFTPTAKPGTVDWGDGSPAELGVRFQSDVPGSITSIRFYKSSANTGRHVGNLWTAAGANLASATFQGETATGWQQVDFANPVPIKAGTVYVASYHTNVGHYSGDHNGFANQLNAPPLHAPANTSSSPNGVFCYGSNSTFPSNGFQATNYWVDVVFSASSGGVPTTTTAPVRTTTTTGVPRTTTTVPRTTTTTARPTTTTTVARTTTTTSAPPPSSGMPNATNTGVPAGTTLRAMSSSSCQWVVTQDNTVVNGVDLAGCIDVEANNVTIQNSRITSNTWWGIKYACFEFQHHRAQGAPRYRPIGAGQGP